MLYLDYAATTYVDPRVLEVMLPYFTEIFSNASSKHECGRKAKAAIDGSRIYLANTLGCSPDDIIFTGGASEANNLAIKGVAEAYEEPRHFITSEFEHKATLQAMRCLEVWGHAVSYIRPQSDGVVHPGDIEDAMRDDTVLCSIMQVNNEIGTIQPVDEIGQLCRDNGVLFHTDATQAYGKMPVRASGADMISLSAHKFYGPKGIGLLYIGEHVPVTCQISGGSQEGGIRAGTLNVPGIVGMAAAAKLSMEGMEKEWDRLEDLEKVFLGHIMQNVPMAFLQGGKESKVPWISNICFYDVDAGRLRDELGKCDICVSRSSACALSADTSHVLEAIGCSPELTEGAIRYSFGHRTTREKVLKAAMETERIVAELRKELQ